jgi:hypothetical protein
MGKMAPIKHISIAHAVAKSIRDIQRGRLKIKLVAKRKYTGTSWVGIKKLLSITD